MARGQVCKTIWGAAGAPIFFHLFILLSPPKAAVSQMGPEGTAPPEGEGNPAEGECFASLN